MPAMTPRIHATIVATALMLFAKEVPAPIVGDFPGLTNLITYSDDIVVALVVTGPKERRLSTFNASQPQRVRVLHVLKGALTLRSEVNVTLSTLDALGGGNFDVGERYVLFLRSDASTTHLVNVRGSVFRVPASTDLHKLHSNDIRTDIGLLVNDLVNQTKGPNAATLEKEAAAYLRPP